MCCASRRLALHEQTEMCGVRNDDTWTRIHSNRHERKEEDWFYRRKFVGGQSFVFISNRRFPQSCLDSPPHSHVNPFFSSSPLSASITLSPHAQNVDLRFQQILPTLTDFKHWTDAFMIMGLDRTELIMLFSLVLVLVFCLFRVVDEAGYPSAFYCTLNTHYRSIVS